MALTEWAASLRKSVVFNITFFLYFTLTEIFNLLRPCTNLQILPYIKIQSTMYMHEYRHVWNKKLLSRSFGLFNQQNQPGSVCNIVMRMHWPVPMYNNYFVKRCLFEWLSLDKLLQHHSCYDKEAVYLSKKRCDIN